MRSLTEAFLTAISAGAVRIGLIVEVDYPVTPLRAWTGVGDLSWDAKTWKGIGDLGNISAIQERAGPDAGNVTLTLAAVTQQMRSLALANASAGRAVRVWLAAFDEDVTGAWSVIDDPWQPFEGISDVHRIVGSVIELSVETELARLRQAKTARYTHEEQQRHFPGDMGFQFAGVVADQPIYWGVASPVGTFSGSTGGGGDNGADTSI